MPIHPNLTREELDRALESIVADYINTFARTEEEIEEYRKGLLSMFVYNAPHLYPEYDLSSLDLQPSD